MAWKRVRYPCKEHGSDFLERIKRQEERKGERGKERKKEEQELSDSHHN